MCQVLEERKYIFNLPIAMHCGLDLQIQYKTQFLSLHSKNQIPLRSRLGELYLEEYTYEEFTVIVRRLPKKRYHMSVEVSEKVAYAVWNRM